MLLILRMAVELFVTLIFRCDRVVYLNHNNVCNKQAEHILYICVCPLFYNKFSVFIFRYRVNLHYGNKYLRNRTCNTVWVTGG
jgi:hypothetical protein